MFKKIGSVFIILGLTVAFGFLKNILLGRGLSKTDFGLFNLLMTLAGLIYPLVMLGQQNTVVRLLSKHSAADYNWKQFIRRILIIVFFLSILAALVATLFYAFGHLEIIFLIIVIISSTIADLYTYIFRAAGQYKSSIFLHRSVRITFPFVLLGVMYLNKMELNAVFTIFAILYVLHSLIIILYTHKKIKAGNKSIPKAIMYEGAIILFSDISKLVIISIDKLLLAWLVDLKSVGEYFAIFAVTRIFDLALHSIDYVLIPQSNKMTHVNIRKITLKVISVGLLISGFYIVLGKPIIHFLYAGKYDSSSHLIPLFCLLGLLQLLHVVPASIIKGRFDKNALKAMTIFDSILMIISIIITYYCVLNWQINGALIATILSWFLRACVAHFIFGKYYRVSGSKDLTATLA